MREDQERQKERNSDRNMGSSSTSKYNFKKRKTNRDKGKEEPTGDLKYLDKKKLIGNVTSTPKS